MGAPSTPPQSPRASAQTTREAHFQALLEGAPVKMWVDAPDGHPRCFNAAWRVYTGRVGSEGAQWIEAVHPEERPRIAAIRAQALAEQRDYNVETRLRRADGAWRWHRAKVSPIRQEGTLVAWVGLAMDIHDVREAEARFRGLADTLPALIFQADARGRIVFVSEHFQTFTGLAPEALYGEGWLSVVHPDDRARAARLWGEAVQTGVPYEAEYRFRRQDGAYRWHLVRCTAVNDDEGNIDHWIGACVDVDDQRRAATRVSESERQFRALAESIPQLVWMADPQGVHLLVQPALVRLHWRHAGRDAGAGLAQRPSP